MDASVIVAMLGPMPRFHFHLLTDGEGPDRDGVELRDLPAARIHARQAIADMMRDALGDGQDLVEIAIGIDDASGDRLARVSAILTVS